MTTKARNEICKLSPQKLILVKHNRGHFTIFILITCVTFFIALHTRFSLQTPPPPSSWESPIFNTTHSSTNHTNDLNFMVHKLRSSVTFLPLKDLRYARAPLEGHTWFMSSMYDTREDGRGKHDGSWNSYALAWPEALPHNTTFMRGLTFVSYSHYNYENLWHGLSAMVPFVAWHKMHNCSMLPSRWVLYHWGELRFKMGLWVGTLMEATFNGPPIIVRFDGVGEDGPVCLEEAVVMRHNEGGMSRERKMEVYDLMRCKARMYCNMSLKGSDVQINDRGLPMIGMTLFLRTGPRSFKNETIVIEIFHKECAKMQGCRFMVAHSNNLTFCEQVKLMSLTDILISPHGAQLTNMFLMERNSSVMEFFPKGWLTLAGVGQYVYHWIASWSGMKHQGSWRDPGGDDCPYSEDDRRCMSIYKNGRIGHNETHFAEWARNVLAEVKTRKIQETSMKSRAASSFGCACC
ncbi:transferase [Spatholobus suberectus]|nr:transferase [Spatholobus suberectus]